MITCPGIIIVDSIIVNNKALPLKRIRANEYATKDELNVIPTVDIIEIIAELRKNVPKLTPAKPLQPLAKFSHRQYLGIRVSAPDAISTLVLREPDTIHKTGYTITNPNTATRR